MKAPIALGSLRGTPAFTARRYQRGRRNRGNQKKMPSREIVMHGNQTRATKFMTTPGRTGLKAPTPMLKKKPAM